MNFLDPFIHAKEWKQMSVDQRTGYKCLAKHFKAIFRTVFGGIIFFQRLSFLYTDVKNYAQTYIQKPHLDMSMETYGSKKLKLRFMPLTKHGMFLEVWPPGKLVGQLAFLKFGTIFYLDKSVVHAGGFTPDGQEAMRLQFVFSETALDVEHFQIK